MGLRTLPWKSSEMGAPGPETEKEAALLETPETATTTFPLAAFAGTYTEMLVALQLTAGAAVPLKVTVLVPWVAPKFVPVMVTVVPTVPEFGLRLVMLGVGKTAKDCPLLATPLTVTTTFPVVALAGTSTVMLVALQLEGVPAVPLKVTVLEPWDAPKFVPVIVTVAPTGPDVGLKLVIVGTGTTVKLTPWLAWPPTVTITLPVVAAAGTVTFMLVLLQLEGVAAVPLKVTVLEPWDAPKFVPVMVTAVPAAPEVGLRLVILGAAQALVLKVASGVVAALPEAVDVII